MILLVFREYTKISTLGDELDQRGRLALGKEQQAYQLYTAYKKEKMIHDTQVSPARSFSLALRLVQLLRSCLSANYPHLTPDLIISFGQLDCEKPP